MMEYPNEVKKFKKWFDVGAPNGRINDSNHTNLQSNNREQKLNITDFSRPLCLGQEQILPIHHTLSVNILNFYSIWIFLLFILSFFLDCNNCLKERICRRKNYLKNVLREEKSIKCAEKEGKKIELFFRKFREAKNQWWIQVLFKGRTKIESAPCAGPKAVHGRLQRCSWLEWNVLFLDWCLKAGRSWCWKWCWNIHVSVLWSGYDSICGRCLSFIWGEHLPDLSLHTGGLLDVGHGYFGGLPVRGAAYLRFISTVLCHRASPAPPPAVRRIQIGIR